ncbi:hypothetical protein AB0B31_23260 [Catellatospora citrea]|uniref:hypothetical protein n=1 Tax=Catellatospora citrea TaxID=53366 RepID=UPI0033D2CDC4
MIRRLHGYPLLLLVLTAVAQTRDSVGTLIWYGSAAETARAEFIALRGEVEVVKPVSEW